MGKFGYTVGCPGRRAANRGTTAVGHAEACRKRIVEELEKIGDERLEREKERLLEYLVGEENKMKKKTKVGSEGDVRASASSSSGLQVPS